MKKIKVKSILLTGATGLLGSQLLFRLLKYTRSNIIILGRGDSAQNLSSRVFKVLKVFGFGEKEIFSNKRLSFVLGDITKVRLGLNFKDYFDLQSRVEQIYHCAALTSFNATKAELWRVNVEGTKNIVEFGRKCFHLVGIEYISTIYVVGRCESKFSEFDLEKNQEFNNAYEVSKFNAELLVKKYCLQGIPINIYRPSVIIGESKKGKVINPGLLYNFARLIKNQHFDVLPFKSNALINLIPCDLAANMIYSLSCHPQKGCVYHIVSATDFRLVDVVRVMNGVLRRSTPRIVSPSAFLNSQVSAVSVRLWKPFASYLLHKPKISREYTSRSFGKLPTVKHGFIRKTLRYYFKNFRFNLINEVIDN